MSGGTKGHRCYGCKYIQLLNGSYPICGYFDVTGNLRSYENGKRIPWSDTEPCKHKIMAKRPHGYVPYGPELEKAAEKAEKLAAAQKKKNRSHAKQGREPIWDAEYAHELYKRGFARQEICKIMAPLSGSTLASFALTHNWKTGKKVFPVRGRDLTEEIRKYQEHKAQKEQSKTGGNE